MTACLPQRLPIARYVRLVAISGILVSIGCGGEFAPVPVSGSVYLDGQPLPQTQVGFEPIDGDGPGSYGKTDAAGKFVLTTPSGKTGAVVGTHRVMIRTFQAEPGANGEIIEIAPELVPSRYHDQPPQFDVPAGGTDAADFRLRTSE